MFPENWPSPDQVYVMYSETCVGKGKQFSYEVTNIRGALVGEKPGFHRERAFQELHQEYAEKETGCNFHLLGKGKFKGSLLKIWLEGE